MGKWATQVRRGKGVSPATEDKKPPVYMYMSSAKVLLPYCFIISTLLVRQTSIIADKSKT